MRFSVLRNPICALFLVLFLCIGNLYSETVVEQIERLYRDNSLNHADTILNVDVWDSDTVRATKIYFRALMHNDFTQSILLHSINFSDYPNEIYGKKSGLKLISVDFINKEFDRALPKIERIDSNVLPDVLYWKAKIKQSMHKFDEAIRISQGFIRSHDTHDLIPYVWLILLESYFAKNDIRHFESNLQTFSRHTRFNEYKAYLFYLNGLLHEGQNNNRARSLYSQVISEFPLSQFRVQAEDRLYAMRTTADTQTTTAPVTPPTPPLVTQQPPPPAPVPPQQPPTGQLTMDNGQLEIATTGTGDGDIAPTGQSEIVTTEAAVNPVINRYEDLTSGAFYIQFGVFSTENAARNFINTLNRENIPTFSVSKPVDVRRLYAVIQGPFTTRSEAQAKQVIYIQNNIQSFIFRKD